MDEYRLLVIPISNAACRTLNASICIPRHITCSSSVSTIFVKPISIHILTDTAIPGKMEIPPEKDNIASPWKTIVVQLHSRPPIMRASIAATTATHVAPALADAAAFTLNCNTIPLVKFDSAPSNATVVRFPHSLFRVALNWRPGSLSMAWSRGARAGSLP